MAGLYRLIHGDNKGDIHYLYIPIEIACKHYLNKQRITIIPKLDIIFNMAIKELEELKNTYHAFPVIGQCIDRYIFTINYHLVKSKSDNADNIAISLDKYVDKTITDEIAKPYTKMVEMWNNDDINIIVDMLQKIEKATAEEKTYYVRSLETLLIPIDVRCHKLCLDNKSTNI